MTGLIDFKSSSSRLLIASSYIARKLVFTAGENVEKSPNFQRIFTDFTHPKQERIITDSFSFAENLSFRVTFSDRSVYTVLIISCDV